MDRSNVRKHKSMPRSAAPLRGRAFGARSRPSMRLWPCAGASGCRTTVLLTTTPSTNHGALDARSEKAFTPTPVPTVPARVRPPTEVEGHGAFGVAGHDPHRRAHGTALALDRDHVFVANTESACKRRGDERGVIPGERGERLGQFLQPRIVRVTAVTERGIGSEDEFDALAGSRWRHRRQRNRGDSSRVAARAS